MSTKPAAGHTDLSLAMTSGFAAILFAAFMIAPTNSLAQSMVTSDLRGVTSAVLLVAPNVVGLGLGPLLTGALSDYFTSATGSTGDGIRYALSVSLIAVAVASLFYLHLASQLREALADHVGSNRPKYME